MRVDQFENKYKSVTVAPKEKTIQDYAEVIYKKRRQNELKIERLAEEKALREKQLREEELARQRQKAKELKEAKQKEKIANGGSSKANSIERRRET